MRYIVSYSGTFDICVNIDGKDKCVGSYVNEGSFGELALMYNMPRAATIIATSEGTLWAMVSDRPLVVPVWPGVYLMYSTSTVQ